MADVTVPQIVIQHSHGSDDWLLILDCGSKIKLRTSEVTRYAKFRMAAVLQASRLFAPMTDEEWLLILAEAMHMQKADAALVASAHRESLKHGS